MGVSMAEDSEFVSPRQFQRRLQERGVSIHLQTIYDRCRTGQLDARRVLRRWRIRAREIARLLEAGDTGE